MAQEDNKHGGARKGSGRKPGTSAVIMERARAYALQRIEAELEPIMDASINLSKGIWVEELDDKGKRIKIYKKAPDVNALKHALDQIIGKPTETSNVNVTGELSLASILGKGALDKPNE